jgi:hypothetical protein
MSPSTLLDLEEVPFAILEAVKARILASRGNIGKPPPSTRPRPQFRKFGASTKGWRKPQYAAGSLSDTRGIGHVAYHFTWFSPGSWTVRIYSGNFSTYLDLRISSREDQDLSNTSFFVLPVEGRTCILVTMQRVRRYYPGPPAQYDDFAFVDKAALCTLTSVRELAIPSQLSVITDRLNPKSRAAGEEEIVINGDDQFPPFQLRDGIDQGWVDGTRFANYNCSPSIFGVLQQISPFVQSSAIRQFPTGRLPVVKLEYFIDERTVNWFNPVDGSVRYAEWRGDPGNFDQAQTDLWTEIEDARWFMPPDFTDPPVTYYLNVWDWDDPDYCRAMCRALGFTNADMTP